MDELMGPTTALEEDPELAFEAQAAAALDNAENQVDEQLRAAQENVATVPIVVARPDGIIYEVEICADESDEGLHSPTTPPPIDNVNGRGAGR